MWALQFLILTHCGKSYIPFRLVNFGISQLVSDGFKELWPDKIKKTKKNKKHYFSNLSYLLSPCAGFSLLGGDGGSPPTNWKLDHRSPPGKISTTTKWQFSCYNPIKTSFLACYCTIFILTSYSAHTYHANFDFRQCSIFTECYFLALKR